MLDFLAQIPWWLPPAIALAAAVLVVSGFTHQQPMRRNIGLVVLALAITVTLLSYFVESDQRKVEKLTRQLVAAASKKDWPTLQGLLSPTTILAVANGAELTPGGGDRIVDLAKWRSDYWQSVSISTIESTKNQTIITVNIDVEASAPALGGMDVPSSWALDWEKSGKNWVLDKITFIRGPNGPRFAGAILNAPRQPR